MNAITKEETNLPVVQSDATSLLTAITQAASNPQVDIEKMERLFAMHQKMVAQEAEAAFNAAMARAQARIEPVANNAHNTQTASRYAKLAAINKVITPIYTAEGLSISFDSGEAPQGLCRTVAIVSHERGHSRQYHLDLPLDDVGAKGTVNKTKVHAMGSTSSYARRYLVCMIFNVTTEDDDDGNRASRPVLEPDPAGKKALEACGSLAALQEAWKALTPEQRKTLARVKDEMKERIQAADREVAA